MKKEPINITQKVIDLLVRYKVAPQADLVRELERLVIEYSVEIGMEKHRNQHIKPVSIKTRGKNKFDGLGWDLLRRSNV